MKLVEILARELKAWPGYGCVAVTQDFDHDVLYWAKSDVNCNEGVWCHSSGKGLCSEIYAMDNSPSVLATDHTTAIVTRAEWETERAKLKAPKANGDGWIRHRGGKCPVEAGVLVDIKTRDGQAWKAQDPVKQCEWRHDGDGLDIMRYKIHKPAEQSAPASEPESELLYDPVAQGPLQWRDRIRELDTQRAEVESTYQRQISEITQECESLVQKLAGEGLALVEVVGRPVKSLDDWRNWQAGDVVEVVLANDSGLAIGSQYAVRSIEGEEYDGAMHVSVWIGVGDWEWPEAQDESERCVFKFVSRPAG